MCRRRAVLSFIYVAFVSLWLTAIGDTASIEVWGWGTTKPVVFDEFTADTGIDVNWVGVKDAYVLRDKIMLAKLSNSLPDIVQLHVYTAEELINAGVVRDLGPLWERDPGDFRWDLIPGAFLDSYKKDGKIYGVPGQITSVILYYNIGLFSNAGMSVPDEKWSLTDQFIQAARRLTVDRNSDNKIDQFGLRPDIINQWIWQLWDLRILNTERTRSGWHDPRATEAWQFYGDLYKKYNVVGGVWTDGNVAMMEHLNSPQRYSGLKIDWDITYFPLSPDGQRRTRVASSAWSVTNSTKNVTAAWSLLKHMISLKSQLKRVETGGDAVRMDALSRMYTSVDPVSLGFTSNSFRNARIIVLSLQYGVADIYPQGWSDLFSAQLVPLMGQIRGGVRPTSEIVNEMAFIVDQFVAKK